MGNPFSSSSSVNMLGSGISDIFGGIGDLQEAKAYNTAAKYAQQNAVIAQETERLQVNQANRQMYQVLGQQQAGYGAANIASSGSALDVRRASLQQGSLQKAVIAEQGMINVQGWEEQSAQYKGMAQQAQAAGTGNIIGGALSAIGSFFLSDDRLKTDIRRVGMTEHGIGIYTYKFRGSNDTWKGVMAQEVFARNPEAVKFDPDGYMMVNYETLGLWPHLERKAA